MNIFKFKSKLYFGSSTCVWSFYDGGTPMPAQRVIGPPSAQQESSENAVVMPMPDKACMACTYLNKYDAASCAMCGGTEFQQPEEPASPSSPVQQEIVTDVQFRESADVVHVVPQAEAKPVVKVPGRMIGEDKVKPPTAAELFRIKGFFLLSLEHGNCVKELSIGHLDRWLLGAQR